MSSIAGRWRKLGGEEEWQGLLDPLDSDLRPYLIHYGDRVQAIYDSFIDETRSKNVGLPRYIPKHLFAKVGLVIGNPYAYVVDKYLYASAKDVVEIPEPQTVAGYSNWIGYIAVSTDETSVTLGRRDILISLRGNIKAEESDIKDLKDLVSASNILGTENDPKLHKGWYSYYSAAESGSTFNPTSFRDQVLAGLSELISQYKEEEISITVTGHGIGGAFGTLIATDIVYNGYNKGFLVTAFVFGNPPVGDQGFSNVYSGLENLHILRVRNERDTTPDTPSAADGYVNVGIELVIDTSLSTYLRFPFSYGDVLEVYLHGIAGTQGSAGGFNLEVNRDLALLNKKLNALKTDYKITAEWWREKNKSLIQLDNGFWALILDRENEGIN